ncbi:MAG TPA: sugar phosphate isomerase/epimerase [Chloroflexota bacterium]|nr:sugar phosphate isomerase/epimerase [Chloroflexota bacterium]
MRVGCHTLVFGAVSGRAALHEITSAGFDAAVVAQIRGQAEHATDLAPADSEGSGLIAVDAATHEVGPGGVAIEHAARLGIELALVAPGGLPGGRPRTRILSDAAAARGVRLAVVPRAGSAIPDAEMALRFAQRVPNVALWPDTSHLARAGDDLAGAARALAPYSAGWFMRDHRGTGGGPGAFEDQVPGRGTLDLAGTIAALADAGFEGPLVFHAVGHLPGGRARPEYPMARVRALAREARDYLSALSR